MDCPFETSTVTINVLNGHPLIWFMNTAWAFLRDTWRFSITLRLFLMAWWSNINPILHGGWFGEPPLVDDLSWFLGGCSKCTQISWLCFFQHFPRPIEAIFQKKIEVLKNWKKYFLIVPTSKGPPFEKKKLKIFFFFFQ